MLYTSNTIHLQDTLDTNQTFLTVRILMTILEVINFGSTCCGTVTTTFTHYIIDIPYFPSSCEYVEITGKITFTVIYKNNHTSPTPVLHTFTVISSSIIIIYYLTKICFAFVLDYRWRNVSTRHFRHGRPRGILGYARSVYANG